MGLEWPEWWQWELELSPHLYKRMLDRDFTEVDLRLMLEKASGFEPDVVENRWIIHTKHRQYRWKVIVEPDVEHRILVVVTAYPSTET